MCFAMFSCNPDDNDTPTSDDLIGTWEVIEFTADAESSVTFNGETTSSISEIGGENLNYTLTFTEDRFSTIGSYDVKTLTMTTGFPTQTDNTSYRDVTGNGSYSISGSQMTIDGAFFVLEVDGMSTAVSNGHTGLRF